MAMLKLRDGLGCILVITILALILVKLLVPSSHAPPVWKGASAKLPCLANNHCPMGQKCAGGFCSENFTNTPIAPAKDMSSCTAPECNGINATCARKDSPCAEGTFCQNNGCVNISAPSEGEAYNQIGRLLD